MNVWNQVFDTFDEADIARSEFPDCATCGESLKISAEDGKWWLRCWVAPGHRGITRLTSLPEPT